MGPSDLSYVDWEGADEPLLQFTARAIALRTAHRIFRRRRFFTGRPVPRADGAPLPDLAWFSFDGRTMSEDDWSVHFGRSVALFLNGEGIRERSPIGERHTDDSFLLLFNGSEIMLEFVLPPADYGEKWGVVLDTSQATGLPAAGEPVVVAAGATVPVPDRGMLVLGRLG